MWAVASAMHTARSSRRCTRLAGDSRLSGLPRLCRAAHFRLPYAPMPLRRIRLQLALVILAAAGLYLIGNGSGRCRTATSLATRRPRGRCFVRDWVVPRLLDEPREKKPVFILLGVRPPRCAHSATTRSRATVRSAVFVTLTLGRSRPCLWRAIGRHRAFWTTFIFATSGLTIAAAKMCITGRRADPVRDDRQKLASTPSGTGAGLAHVVILGLATGLGILTKGPVVPGILVLTGLAMLALSPFTSTTNLKSRISNFKSQISDFKCANSRAGSGADHRRRHRRAVARRDRAAVAGVHDRARFRFRSIRAREEPQEGHKGPPGYYLLTIWGTYFPVEPVAARAQCVHAWRNRRMSRDPVRVGSRDRAVDRVRNRASTKLPHYILPIFPPIAFLTADMLIRAARTREAN